MKFSLRIIPAIKNNIRSTYTLIKSIVSYREYFVDKKTYWILKNNPNIVEELYRRDNKG